jgi:hypothetical protein
MSLEWKAGLFGTPDQERELSIKTAMQRKQAEREEIERLTAVFLAFGGRIDYQAPTVNKGSDPQGLQDRRFVPPKRTH